MPLLSVIITIYNVEPHIKKCIESVLSQDYDNLEIILIDDGSKDNSGEICDEFVKQDNRVVVVHQENNGVSAARNHGISKASGEYIAFIDGDDYIDSMMYETLMSNIIKYNADISACGYHDVYANRIISSQEEVVVDLFKKEDAIKLLFGKNDKIKVFTWNKVYKKRIFEKIKFPIGEIYEDVAIILDILSECDRIVATNQPLYYYVHRDTSITKKQYTYKDNAGIVASQRNFEYISAHYNGYEDNSKIYLCKMYFLILDKLILSGDRYIEERRRIVSDINKNFSFVLIKKEMPFNRKISAIALKINFKVYKILFFLNRKIKKTF